MKQLDTADQFAIRAAQGWLELGSPVEAEAELSKVSNQGQSNPAFLLTRWAVAARRRDWQEGQAISGRLLSAFPEVSAAWAVQAETIRQTRSAKQAADFLSPALDLFPDDSGLRYALACYCCEAGDVVEARRWLTAAFRIIGADPNRTATERGQALKQMYHRAISDAELQPLWKEMLAA